MSNTSSAKAPSRSTPNRRKTTPAGAPVDPVLANLIWLQKTRSRRLAEASRKK
ncbi:hypothetical protein ACFV97_02355 [Streptomyces sp. NPDC059913]|uniref:hypothetical protein n=1 Tax=unclassified Streptomyces TaxID=2593676 RepID=UPI003659450A